MSKIIGNFFFFLQIDVPILEQHILMACRSSIKKNNYKKLIIITRCHHNFLYIHIFLVVTDGDPGLLEEQNLTKNEAVRLDLEKKRIASIYTTSLARGKL